MSNFQAFAVRGKSGPVVTLQAGVDFGGYYWTTTSRRAGKVAALRRDPNTSVLSRKDDSWRLRAGHAYVLDVSRPPEALRELPVFALAGGALALIAVRYPEQLLGYVVDAASTPQAWRLQSRVLIAVRHEDELAWTDDGVITHQTERFLGGPESAARESSSRDADGACWLGLDSDAGPIALPGRWAAGRSVVGVPASVLAAVNARLPGRACITVDDSDSPRPSGKSGSIARGNASRPRVRASLASITVKIDSTTTWTGFQSNAAA